MRRFVVLASQGFIVQIVEPSRKSMYNQMIFVEMLWYNLRLAQQSLPE
jgi:hypothetical protein